MLSYQPTDLSHKDFHQVLLSGVAPRPIAFVSSLDSNGNCNLAPFSFFNAYASKPPVVAIGPAIAAATGKVKDTWKNIMETKECTINTVTYSMIEQMNLASTDYEFGIDEFVKAGFGKTTSTNVKPPLVTESPFSMECSLIDNIELFREEGGNGNIMLLRVLRLHVKESVLTDGKIDPRKMDFVARMGYKWYSRVTPETCFESAQPRVKGIGFDALPEFALQSNILTGNDLAKLAGVTSPPDFDTNWLDSTINSTSDSYQIEILTNNPIGALSVLVRDSEKDIHKYHKVAQLFLQNGLVQEAWQTLFLVHKK